MATLTDDRLSPDQSAAVSSDEAAIVVLAGAGSGKTEVVARRVERLLSGSPNGSFRVLALSYTMKAADELRDRFVARLGQLHRRVDTNTVHGFAHSLLRQQGTRIGLPVEPEVLTRDEDRAELLTRWLDGEGRAAPADLVGVFQRMDVMRARLQPAELLVEWEAALESEGALDYGSMLTHATRLLRLGSSRRQLSRLYAHVIVDEAQNLTPAQYEMLVALVGEPEAEPRHLPIMLVGDDKQSIVSFAGADPRLMSRFQREYHAQRFELKQNFRSAMRIVALGQTVAHRLGQSSAPEYSATHYAAAGMVARVEGSDETEEGEKVADWIFDLLENGIPEHALAPGENRGVLAREIAVLARTAPSLRAVRAALEARGLAVATSSSPEDWLSTTAGKTALELVSMHSASAHRSTHWQLSRLLGAYESEVNTLDRLQGVLAAHPDPFVRALRPLCTSNSPSDFMTALSDAHPTVPSTGNDLANWEADSRLLQDAWERFTTQSDRHDQTWGNYRLFVSRLQRGNDADKGVRLSTIHRAQGREYRVIALIALNDGQLPDFRADTSEEQEAELRAFYVAVTRPSRALLLSRARTRQTRYGSRSTSPSPYFQFLDEVTRDPSRGHA